MMVDKVKRERAERAPARYKYQLVVLTDQPQDSAVRRYAKREGLSVAGALRKLLADALAADLAARQAAKVATPKSAPADKPTPAVGRGSQARRRLVKADRERTAEAVSA